MNALCTTVPRALTIAGSDSGGGAGIQADLKTFTSLGIYGTSAITAVTAQNTTGVTMVHVLPPELIAAQIRAVVDDIGTDAAKTGMLADAATIEVVGDELSRGIPRLVVDPVMLSKGGVHLLKPEAFKALVDRIFPLATVITPNLDEAAVLTGNPVETLDNMREAARRLHDKGPAWVVVKGGHLAGSDAVDVVFNGTEFYELRSPRYETNNTHGTGCTFSAALTAFLAQGMDILPALQKAKEVIGAAIKNSLNLGRGHGPTNHFFYRIL